MALWSVSEQTVGMQGQAGWEVLTGVVGLHLRLCSPLKFEASRAVLAPSNQVQTCKQYNYDSDLVGRSTPATLSTPVAQVVVRPAAKVWL